MKPVEALNEPNKGLSTKNLSYQGNKKAYSTFFYFSTLNNGNVNTNHIFLEVGCYLLFTQQLSSMHEG